MKLYKIKGNCGWLIYSTFGKFTIENAETVYKSHFNNQKALVKTFYELNITYPNVVASSLYD